MRKPSRERFRAFLAPALMMSLCLFVIAGFLAVVAMAAFPRRQARAREGGQWWNRSVFYEIFVRSFQDSNDDGVGDLRGIESRLGYLRDTLGIDALWLTPIFQSPSYHGYDTTDYLSIQPDFGTLDDFKSLLRSAHARGIRVVLDLAVNHTSDRHPWFGAPATHDWYVWRPTDPGWGAPERWFERNGELYYGFFGASMPDLNWRNNAVEAEVERIVRFWASLGVDGFRLDAARYYVPGPHGEPDTAETHRRIRQLTQAMRSEFPDLLFVGEVWAGSDVIAPYLRTGRELDLAFDFPVAGGIRDSLKSGSAAPLVSAIRESLALIPARARLAPFFNNHDMTRIVSELPPATSLARLRLAAATLLSLPGTPFIYYGDEIGMPDGDSPPLVGDAIKRTPMLWAPGPGHGFTAPGAEPWEAFSGDGSALSVQEELARPDSLARDYAKLIALRKGEPCLQSGSIELLAPTDRRASGNPAIAAWVRRGSSGDAVVVALNYGENPSAPFDLRISGRRSGARGPDLLWGTSRPGLRADAAGWRLSFDQGLRPFEAVLVKIGSC